MRERVARIALYDRIVADDVTATVTSGSTTSVVKVGSGQAASFSKGDVANITGTGASAANHRRVLLVTARDTTLHTVTVSPALDAVPLSGDVLGKGWRQWARAPGAADQLWLYVGPLYGEHPAIALLRATPDEKVVAIMASLSEDRVAGDLMEPGFRIRILGLYLEHVEGAEARLRDLLDARPSGLTMAVGKCHDLVVGQTTAPIRTDDLVERVVPISVGVAPALVA